MMGQRAQVYYLRFSGFYHGFDAALGIAQWSVGRSMSMARLWQRSRTKVKEEYFFNEVNFVQALISRAGLRCEEVVSCRRL